MNHFTGYELLWLFFVYSFVGWVLETVFAAMQQKKFVNRGLVNGSFCVLYGITSVLMTVGLQELDGYICISASAFWGALGFVVVRWGIAAETSWQEWMDVHYDDAKMAQIYPNAKAVE